MLLPLCLYVGQFRNKNKARKQHTVKRFAYLMAKWCVGDDLEVLRSKTGAGWDLSACILFHFPFIEH